MYRHGLRVSETVRLKKDQVNLRQARIWVKRAKGSLDTEQPLAGDELRALKRYLAVREDHLPWLFVSERGHAEVTAAKGFSPALAEFTIATIAANDTKLQDHVRSLT